MISANTAIDIGMGIQENVVTVLHPHSNAHYIVCKCDITVVEMLAFWCLQCSIKLKNQKVGISAYKFFNAVCVLIFFFKEKHYVKKRNGRTGRISNAEEVSFFSSALKIPICLFVPSQLTVEIWRCRSWLNSRICVGVMSYLPGQWKRPAIDNQKSPAQKCQLDWRWV